MRYTSKQVYVPSINPNQRQQVTISYCCSIAFIKIQFQQNTILQQPSTSPIQNQVWNNLEVKGPNIVAMDVIGSMLSVSVAALRMPRFLLNTAIYVLKIGPKTSQKWMALLPSIGQLILGVYPKFHMNQSLVLTDLMYCQCKNAVVQIGMPRTPTFGVNLLIILKECNGMS